MASYEGRWKTVDVRVEGGIAVPGREIHQARPRSLQTIRQFVLVHGRVALRNLATSPNQASDKYRDGDK
jgi:hypothetical protein